MPFLSAPTQRLVSFPCALCAASSSVKPALRSRGFFAVWILRPCSCLQSHVCPQILCVPLAPSTVPPLYGPFAFRFGNSLI